MILAHRLLKNSIASDEYLLMTESAIRDIEFPTEVEVQQGEENYDGFGAIRTYTYLRAGGSAPRAAAVERLYADRGRAFAIGLRLLAKGYFGEIQILFGLKSVGSYGNLGEVQIRPLARATMALRAILMAPFLIPFGAGVQAYRALTRRTLSERRRRS